MCTLYFQFIIKKYNIHLSGNEIKIKINNQLLVERTTNHGVREDYTLPPKAFNIYINEIIVRHNQIYTKGTTLSTGTKISNLLDAENEVAIADPEDKIQRAHTTKHSNKFWDGNITRKT